MSTTLLVIDEDPRRLEVRATFLRTCGYRVFTAAHGPEALRMLDRGWFEAACCVLHATSHPASDAAFLIAKQSDARFAHIPVILLADRPASSAPAPPPIRDVLATDATQQQLASSIRSVVGAPPTRPRTPQVALFDDSETTDVG